MLNFSVTNQTLTLNSGPRVVADSQNYLIAKFDFSSDWDGTYKIALFSRASPTEYFFPLGLDEENECKVPWEILQGEGKITVSVYGNNYENEDNKIITANALEIDVYQSGFISAEEGDAPSEPTPGVAGSYLTAIIEAKTNAENAAVTATEKAEAANTSANAANQKAAEAVNAATLAKDKAAEANESATKAMAAREHAEEIAEEVMASTPEGYIAVANVIKGLTGYRLVIDPEDNGINIVEESEVTGE